MRSSSLLNLVCYVCLPYSRERQKVDIVLLEHYLDMWSDEVWLIIFKLLEYSYKNHLFAVWYGN